MSEEQKHLYFVGIGGTGMASTAGLMKACGYKVSGSDKTLYPPMSLLLKDLDISVFPKYSTQNISQNNFDLFVIGNSLSKSHMEVDYILKQGLNYTSFPKLLFDTLLKNKKSIVVAGTHGKTTTSSLISYCLDSLGEDPSFFIGGIAKNFEKSFALKDSKLFVIEGDEYDTAFFDKESKFLHYSPHYLVLNNIEFDHADIFENLEQVYATFEKLLKLVKDPRKIIANIDDKGVCEVSKRLGIYDKIFKVSCYGASHDADVYLESTLGFKGQYEEFRVYVKGYGSLKLSSKLLGAHNCANIIQTLAVLEVLKAGKSIKEYDYEFVQETISKFEGVQKRFEFLGTKNGALCFNDFAHHPTAVRFTLESVRKKYPQKRIIAAFEPRNASSRRNIFTKEYGQALGLADVILLTPVAKDIKIPANKRMDLLALKNYNFEKTHLFDSTIRMHSWLEENICDQDLVLFMSCGDFEGILSHYRTKQ